MGLHGLICGCFASPKANNDELPQVTQGLPVEVVSAGNAAKQTEELQSASEATPPVNDCVAKDSVNSIADDQMSRAAPGVGYQYEMPSARAPLSSRALVGGVEYDSFFVNPLAEGSHDGGVPIDYAGATLGVGIGHNNPLAAEYFDVSSTASPSAPGSPAQTKIRTLSPRSGGGGCVQAGDTACPAAPGTPLQARMTVKLIGVDIGCDTALCSERSGSLHLPTDAMQCLVSGEEEEEEAEEEGEDATIGLVPLGGAADRRASVEGSGYEAGWGVGSCGGAESGSGAEPHGPSAGKERVGGDRGARAVCGLRRTTDDCSMAAASRTDSSRSLGSLQTTPLSSPGRPENEDCSSGGASSGGSTGGGTSGGACGPYGAVRAPSKAEQSPASAVLPPPTPLSAVDIGRRIASETESLAEQHESDIEESSDRLDGSTDGGSSGGGVAQDAAFAPRTPPLAVRDGTSGGGMPSQGGRGSRWQSQAADSDEAAQSGGGGAGSGGAVLVYDVTSQVCSAVSVPSPPRMALEATEGRLLAAWLLHVRSLQKEGAAPLPPSLTVWRPACERQAFMAAGWAEAATVQACESQEKQEQEEEGDEQEEEGDEQEEGGDEQEEEGVHAPYEVPLRGVPQRPPAAAAQLLPEAPSAPGSPLPPRVSLSAGDGGPAAEAAAAAAVQSVMQGASEVGPVAVDSTRPDGDLAIGGAPPDTRLALLHPSAPSLKQGCNLPDLRKAFNSCGGGGGRNSTCSSCEIPVAPPPPTLSMTSTATTACLFTQKPPSAPRRGRGVLGDSISGLTMTRVLIRQIGLVQTPRSTADELPASPSAPSPLACGCAAASHDAPSPFAAAIDAALEALEPQAVIADVQDPAAPPGGGPIEYGKSHESASVTFALELPCGQATSAAPAAAALPVADVFEVERRVSEAAVGGVGAAEDDGLSSSLTSESSSLCEERSSYSGLYGVVSARSLEGWLEPQGWKPLRERYGGGVQQH